MSIGQMRTVDDGMLASEAPQASLLGLLNVLLRHRWLVLLPTIAVPAIVAILAYIAPRSYTATTAFVPQVRSAASPLAGVSAQLGIGLAVGDPMQSPQFYVELVESREILHGVAETHYDVPSSEGAVSGTLADIYQPSDPTPEQRRDALIRKLGEQVAAQTRQTGIVRVAVTTPYRELSTQIADRILALVSDFNLQTRQSQARAERRFIEGRLADVQDELRVAESKLQTFLQRNREFGVSSSLAVERERLDREVATRRALYGELVQNFERARMEEVRDTPVITVLERPETPALPDPRGLLRNGVLALLAGAVLGVLLAFGREYLWQLRRREVDDYEQFRRLRRDSLRDVIHPWQAISRLMRGQSAE